MRKILFNLINIYCPTRLEKGLAFMVGVGLAMALYDIFLWCCYFYYGHK